MSNEIRVNNSKLIDELVDHFVNHKALFERALLIMESCFSTSPNLNKLIHSKKSRIKDPTHLKDKLIRKMSSCKQEGAPFDINKENLFSKINDLVGYRIIHLHTTQIEKIDLELKKIFKEEQWILIEGPNARTWDLEFREYFAKIGIATSENKNMYTSVHYVIQPNTNAPITCEIQVRTLMEEVWGEVDHTINYPHKTLSLSCQDQIKVLARMTSSCSRLVDSIFSSQSEYDKNKKSNRSKNNTSDIPIKKQAVSSSKKVTKKK